MAKSRTRSIEREAWPDTPRARPADSRSPLEAEGGAVRAGAVAKRLGVSPATVESLRLSGYVLAVPRTDGYAYPVWQFDGRSMLPGFRKALGALGGADPYTQLTFFLTPNVQLDGRRPLDVLRMGIQETVIRAARTFVTDGN